MLRRKSLETRGVRSPVRPDGETSLAADAQYHLGSVSRPRADGEPTDCFTFGTSKPNPRVETRWAQIRDAVVEGLIHRVRSTPCRCGWRTPGLDGVLHIRDVKAEPPRRNTVGANVDAAVEGTYSSRWSTRASPCLPRCLIALHSWPSTSPFCAQHSPSEWTSGDPPCGRRALLSQQSQPAPCGWRTHGLLHIRDVKAESPRRKHDGRKSATQRWTHLFVTLVDESE